MNIIVQNATVYVLEQGAGTPTLFLHGNPDSAEMWGEVMARMSQNYRCLAPDLPGYGRSALLPDFQVSLENEARWVADLVDTLAIREPLNLVMHDFGGHFGLAWAIRQPERVRPPLGETTEKGLYVDPSATFSQAYHPSSRGPFEKRAPMRSPVAGDGHGTPCQRL